jgi:hydrogenase expression/formation protein HypC
MCLGVPGRVVECDEFTALVDFWGVRRRVRLDLADEPVAVGDYVLNHVGFVIRRIPSEDVETTLSMYEELVKANTGSGPADLMAADVRAEIAAAGSSGAGRAGGAGGSGEGTP